MNAQNKNVDDKDLVAASVEQTAEDFKNAGLIVSLLINLCIFSTWLVLEVTDAYNAQVMSYLAR